MGITFFVTSTSFSVAFLNFLVTSILLSLFFIKTLTSNDIGRWMVCLPHRVVISIKCPSFFVLLIVLLGTVSDLCGFIIVDNYSFVALVFLSTLHVHQLFDQIKTSHF